MSSNKAELLHNLSAHTGRGASPNLWAGNNCPWLELKEDSNVGWYVDDDFTTFPLPVTNTTGNIGNYKYFTSASSPVAIADAGLIGGALTFTSDGDDEGASLGSAASSFLISRSTGKVWFEARIKTSTIADTKHGFFLGLMEPCVQSATVPIAAAGTMADQNFVGFHRLEGDGDYVDWIYKANGVTQVTKTADFQVLVADTWIKLGFFFNPDTYYITPYVNGIEKTASKISVISAAGTDFPNDVTMNPIFAVLNAATSPGTSTLDWVRAVQLAV